MTYSTSLSTSIRSTSAKAKHMKFNIHDETIVSQDMSTLQPNANTNYFNHAPAKNKSLNRLMRSVAVAALLSSSAGLSITLDAGKAIAGDTVVLMPVGTSTEQPLAGESVGAEDFGITISVDGERVIGNELRSDVQRQEDVALDQVDIQVKFDGLEVRPLLNVSTRDVRRSYTGGQKVQFLATSNYPAWIARQEVRLYAKDDSFAKSAIGKSARPVDVLEVDADGLANWQMPNEGEGEFVYVLRVYDDRGRYDETVPLDLKRTSRAFVKHQVSPDENAVSPGNGEDRTAFRNIPVHGGAVTIYGNSVPAGYKVKALGETIPVDNQHAFVVQRILPPGEHEVDVAISGGKNDTMEFARDVNIPANDWFYVALADLTVGKKRGSGKLIAADPSDYDGVYKKGRLAFYLKGKVQGKYLITASADTGEGKLEDLLSGMDGKNPRELLQRIDPNKYYPVYGDDSTAIEDAPTSGKFYVRIERGDSHVMWGNFKASINGSKLVRNERALYGANLVLKSENTTSFGERTAEVTAYAAQSGTLPQRDVLRGTGGSAYFLKRQDLTSGSETVTVEIRDNVTGLVKSRKILRYGEDYTINYVQGVIILKSPLSSTASDGSAVSDAALGENVVNLVVQYEYTPGIGEVDGYSYGARGQAWLGDHLRVGVTGMKETTGNAVKSADQQIVGVDAKLRVTDTTYIEGEYAKSKGPGFGKSVSDNGGLTIVDLGSVGINDRVAEAWRVKGQLDLADVTGGSVQGRVGAWYDHKDAGFSTLDHDILVTQRIYGAYAEIEPDEFQKYRFEYEDFSNADGVGRRQALAEAIFTPVEEIEATIGAKHTRLETPTTVKDNGSRTDIGARLAYSPDEDQTYYVFGQWTAKRDGNIDRNDRIGLGLKKQLSEKVGVEAEISKGTSGVGGIAAVTYNPTADDQYYIGYRLDPDRTYNYGGLNSRDLGGIVLGSRRQIDDKLTAFAENNYDMFGKTRSLTSTYGVTYTPDAVWTYTGGAEVGNVRIEDGTDFDRTAISLGVSYNDNERITARLRGEARFEDSADNSKDRDTWLFSAGMGFQYNPDWRLIADLDAVISNSDQSSILDGDYVEGSIGFAYRPIENDRFNALFKYAFLYDLPGPDQVNAFDQALGPRQKSHVLSADGTWEINEFLDLGVKYGVRVGQSETVRGSGEFIDNHAQIGIIRADWHVIHNWDILLEGRVLHSNSAETTDFGVLAAVYRHIGNNMKIGVGYNFGKFSDDLTDLTYDDKGVFVNLVGKF